MVKNCSPTISDQVDHRPSSQRHGDFVVPRCWRRRCPHSRSPWRCVAAWRAGQPRQAAFLDDSYVHAGCSCHAVPSCVRNIHIRTASNPNIQVTGNVKEFEWASHLSTGGHKYKLYKKSSSVSVRYHFFSERIVNVWNSLPDEDDFRTVKSFTRTIKCVTFNDFVSY